MRGIIEQEANAVADVYILARGLPEPEQKKVKELAVKYVDTVIDDEWDAMKKGKISTKAIGVGGLWNVLIDFKPTADDQKDIRQMSLDRVSELGDNRRARLIASAHGVSTELWTVLLIGGVLTLGFSYFLGMSSVIGQGLMTVIIASTLALNVYLVFLFGYPFSGAYCVQPDGFVVDRVMFRLRESKNWICLQLSIRRNSSGCEEKFRLSHVIRSLCPTFQFLQEFIEKFGNRGLFGSSPVR